MKKIFFSVILILLAFGAVWYWPQIKPWFDKGQQLLRMEENNQNLANLKQQVLTGGALRGNENAPDAYLTRAGTINFTNQARKDNGNLRQLTENAKLDLAAKNKLQDMFKNQYFEHISPSGQGPADQAKTAGYQYVIIGENLALGNFKNDQSLVTAWMNSPGHRANILNAKFEEIGVAVGHGIYKGQKVWMAVQEFGRPLSSCPAIDQNLKNQLAGLKQDVDTITPQLQALKKQINSLAEPASQDQVDAYNQKVGEYNALVKVYNNKVDQLKQATGQYNSQVQMFNDCAS